MVEFKVSYPELWTRSAGISLVLSALLKEELTHCRKGVKLLLLQTDKVESHKGLASKWWPQALTKEQAPVNSLERSGVMCSIFSHPFASRKKHGPRLHLQMQG